MQEKRENRAHVTRVTKITVILKSSGVFIVTTAAR